MPKAESNKEEILETTASLATAMKTGIDAAVAAFLSELDGIFTIKEETKTAKEAFLNGKCVFTLLLPGFSEILVNHSSTLWLTIMRWWASIVASTVQLA